MKEPPRTQETIAPNLIPMIDIMFLLLLFFMLGADMGHRELEDVVLPKAAQATENNQEDRLVINAHHRVDVACDVVARRETCRSDGHWRIAIKGRDCTDRGALAAVLQTETAATRHVVPGGSSVSDRKVMIRADGAAPYALAQQAMNVCAEQGIYKVEVAASVFISAPQK